MSGFSSALLTLLWWLMLPGPRAQAIDLQLQTALPRELAGCVTEQQLRLSYAQALAAHGGGGATVGPLRVSVIDLGRSPDEPSVMLLDLVVTSAGGALGRRTLPVRARDCAALSNALALVLVLLASHTAPDSATPAQNSPPAPVEPPPSSRVALAAGALVLFGVLEHTAFGLQLRAATTGSPWSVRLAASAFLPQELKIAEGALRWHSYELAVEGCAGGPLPSLPSLALRLCAGPRLGWTFAQSRGFTLENQRVNAPLVYLGIAPEAALRLGGGTWLQLGAALAAALLRPRFVVGLEAGLRERELDEPSFLRAEVALSVAQIF